MSADIPVPACEVVAHRGDPLAAVENTVASIHRAVLDGATTVEIDVRVTSDGVPVLLHDETTARIWGRDEAAAEQSAARIAALSATAPDGSRTSIPTLAEALAAAAPARLLIDLPDAACVPPCLEAVSARDADVPAPAWCGSAAGLLAVREGLPEAEIWLSRDDAELPAARLIAALRPRTWNPEHVHVAPARIAELGELGLVTTCWTVDGPARAVELARMGVRGIISNRAAEVRRAVAADRARTSLHEEES